MPEDGKTLIMKFGGASVRTPASFARVAEIIAQRSEVYPQIVVVVSAMGDMTDQLIDLAFQVNPTPPKREYDMLVSVGERISIALLAMALSSIGKDAVSFTGSQSGIITTSEHTDAKIIDVRPARLLQFLQLKKIVIVAGFQGMSKEKEITTLGRGGSDTSAVALGIALNADCVEFYKDVLGVYEKDPKIFSDAKFHSQLSYDKALEIVINTGSTILHPRALRLAMDNFVPLYVKSVFDDTHEGTRILAMNQVQRQPHYTYEKTVNQHTL